MAIKLSKKDVIWGYFSQFFSIASGIMVLPLVLRKLPPDEIGMNYLMLAVASMVSLFDFGFAPQVGRNISYIFGGAQILKKEGVNITEGENREINYRLLATMIYTAKYIYQRISFIVLFVMLTFGTLYIYKVTNGFTSIHHALLIWVIFSTSTFFNIYYTYYASLLLGKGLIEKSEKAMVYSRVLYILLVLIFLLSGMGLLGVVLASLVAPFASRYISYHYFFTKDMRDKIDCYEITKKEKVDLLEIIWHNAKKIGLVYIGSYAVTKIGMFMIGLYLPLKDVASYGLMLQLVGVISSISGAFFIMNNPRFSSLKVAGNNTVLLKDFSFSMGVYYALFIAGSACLIFIAPFLLSVIKSNAVLPPTMILLFYTIIILLELNHSYFATIIVIGNTVPFMWISLITGGLIALGSYVSLAFTGLGILGLVLAQGLVQIAYNNWKWPLVVCRDFKINFFTFLYFSCSELYRRLLG